MRLLLIVAILCLPLPTLATAQTVLTLSATGSAQSLPDEMTASLEAQANAADAAGAQADLNRRVAKALAAVKAVPSVSATTGGYGVDQSDPEQTGQTTGYQATQALMLLVPAPGGVPPEAFTALVGRLQQQGLLLNALDGQLSTKAANAASHAATTDAITQIRAEAAAIAATLGDTVGDIKSLDVSSGTPVMPLQMKPMAATATPPQAAPGPQTVSVSIDAVIDLTPPAQ